MKSILQNYLKTQTIIYPYLSVAVSGINYPFIHQQEICLLWSNLNGHFDRVFSPDKEHEEMTDKTTDTTKNRRTFDPAFKLQVARMVREQASASAKSAAK
ncbi:hypothetical protein IE984_11350 [Klebsiella pneumoniae]|nr:hypothetical protein [Klebsiella pneumoniae]